MTIPWGGAARLPVATPGFYRWVIAERMEPNLRVISVLEDDPNHPAYRDEVAKRDTPYWVLEVEERASVYEAGSYGAPEDHRAQVRRFATAHDAEDFLSEHYGLELAALADPRSVGVP